MAAALVILDKNGRGTSTYDGVSLAWAITEYLHDRIGCWSLFATHYHGLTRLEASQKGARNSTVQVQGGPEGIVFLHRILPGSADRSDGMYVTRLADVPREVLERAEQVLTDLEGQSSAGKNAEPDGKRNGRMLRVV